MEMIDELFLDDMHEAEITLGEKVEEPTEEELSVIRTVYLWHPALLGFEGRKNAARLYVSCGMMIFWDMLPRAKAIEKAQNDAEIAAERANDLKKKLAELRQCRTLPKEN